MLFLKNNSKKVIMSRKTCVAKKSLFIEVKKKKLTMVHTFIFHKKKNKKNIE